MRYAFLVDTYATERIKVVSVWSEFRDEDLPVRPNASDPRGRSVHEQMVHQCVSEDLWFRNMLGIDVGARPLPQQETRVDFIREYVNDSGRRLSAIREKMRHGGKRKCHSSMYAGRGPGSWCEGLPTLHIIAAS